MFDNIGGKIKNFAKSSFVAEAIAAIITGFVMIVEDSDMILVGLITMITGPIGAWILSSFIYGFGQLIENSDILVQQGRNRSENQSKNSTETSTAKHQWRCDRCGHLISEDICPICNKDRRETPAKAKPLQNIKKDENFNPDLNYISFTYTALEGMQDTASYSIDHSELVIIHSGEIVFKNIAKNTCSLKLISGSKKIEGIFDANNKNTLHFVRRKGSFREEK